MKNLHKKYTVLVSAGTLTSENSFDSFVKQTETDLVGRKSQFVDGHDYFLNDCNDLACLIPMAQVVYEFLCLATYDLYNYINKKDNNS